MTTSTAIVILAFIGGAVYLIRLAILERGDFEASARAGMGNGEFSLKAKQRKR